MSEESQKRLLVSLALVGLAAGLGAVALGRPEAAGSIWIAGTVPVLVALLVEIISSLRRGEVGLDIVAALSMTAALAVGEYLAAAVVALMYSGGTLLENYAEGRARQEMHALLSRVPRSAMRHRNGALEEVPLDEIHAGNRLLIRQGDIIPVDGTLAADRAVLDQSALTGESLPVRLARGDFVMSGSTNAGEAFDLDAASEAAESTYAGIVRLVEFRAPVQGADVAAGGSLLVGVPCGDAADLGGRMVADRRSDPRGGRAGRGHAVSADPCSSSGAGRGS